MFTSEGIIEITYYIYRETIIYKTIIVSVLEMSIKPLMREKLLLR